MRRKHLALIVLLAAWPTAILTLTLAAYQDDGKAADDFESEVTVAPPSEKQLNVSRARDECCIPAWREKWAAVCRVTVVSENWPEGRSEDVQAALAARPEVEDVRDVTFGQYTVLYVLMDAHSMGKHNLARLLESMGYRVAVGC